MRIFYTAKQLKAIAKTQLSQWAFIPTMGALHQGHLSLIEEAKKEGYSVVVSIFVNPTQFNNSDDLAKYPRTIYADLLKLSTHQVDAVFLPSEDEIYPKQLIPKSIHLSSEAEGLEGQYRPGHFEGVVMVLRRLFEMVEPGPVFFGQKDLQQCMVVRNLIQEEFPHIKFNMVSTLRESDGLAMSSRNIRLNESDRKNAHLIYQSLLKMSTQNLNELDVKELEHLLLKSGIQTEYMNYVTLPKLNIVNNRSDAHAVVYAGYLGGVRLIDNLIFREVND